jgi:(4S)-4-hydroxy-5-phosphonooxypentane-2,3-dione isomerase
MYIVHVHIQVKPEFVDEFLEATLENASNSILEPGVARFDVIQQIDDPTQFVLVEVYRTPDDPAKHKKTDHYLKWRNIAEPLMLKPRTRQIYVNQYPDENGWN